jgi:hypothetical protein
MLLNMKVRRLAALDMYGLRGSQRRRRIILAEFLVGVVLMVGFGVWLLGGSSSSGGRAFAPWMVGAGLNYVPLAVHALKLSRPGVLEAELINVETGRELRRYGLLQLWILVPLALIVLTGYELLTRGQQPPTV